MIRKKKNKDFYDKKYNDLKNNINLYSKKIPLYNLFLNNSNNSNTNSWYDKKIYNTEDLVVSLERRPH